jgi:HD-like signal output (HDOD) protein
VDPALALDELEAADLGETHAQRLEALMRGWEFPDLLQQAAGSHHAPHGAPSAARPLAAVVRAAHAIVGSDPSDFCDAPADREAESALAELALQPEDVADVRSELSERMKELARVL